MGTPGVPFNVPKAVILESIKKRQGVIVNISKDLDVCYETCLKHIRLDQELSDELDRQRNAYKEELCDLAENTLKSALIQTKDLPSALSSSKFVLNNLGRKRGYTPPTITTTDEHVKKADAQIDRLSQQLSELRMPSTRSSETDSRTDSQSGT